MTETRRRLERAVSDSPGLHFNALVRELDLAPGQVQYHLRRLRQDGRVIEASLYGRTHYYPPTYDGFERTTLALLRRETSRDLLVTLVEKGPTRPTALADHLDIARSTIQWHLDRLDAAELIERRGNDRVLVAATDPETTVRLLREIEPSLPERLSDRFARLVDRLLEE